MWKTKFCSHQQYLVGLLFSRNVKKVHTDQSILQTFLFCLKRNVSQVFDSSSWKKSFSNVYIIDTTWFDECFWFHVITGRHYFYKCIVTQRFGTTTMLLRSLKQVFWRKSTLYIGYLLNNITMLLKFTMRQNFNLFVDNFFLLFFLTNVLHFSLLMKFLKIKSEKLRRDMFSILKVLCIQMLMTWYLFLGISENKNT